MFAGYVLLWADKQGSTNQKTNVNVIHLERRGLTSISEVDG